MPFLLLCQIIYSFLRTPWAVYSILFFQAVHVSHFHDYTDHELILSSAVFPVEILYAYKCRYAKQSVAHEYRPVGTSDKIGDYSRQEIKSHHAHIQAYLHDLHRAVILILTRKVPASGNKAHTGKRRAKAQQGYGHKKHGRIMHE